MLNYAGTAHPLCYACCGPRAPLWQAAPAAAPVPLATNIEAIEGMVIAPGDLIVGDGDGVVCVPYDATSEVLKATEAKHQAEIKQLAAIKAGSSDRAWVDATLTRLGCIIES